MPHDPHDAFLDNEVISADSRLLATLTPTGVRLWDLATGKERPSSKIEGRFPHFSRDSTLLITSCSGSKLASDNGREPVVFRRGGSHKLWDTTTEKELASLDSELAELAPDGKTVVTFGMDEGVLKVWDVDALVKARLQ